MAIKGVARFYEKRKKHIVTTQTEHKCVLDSCRALEQDGFDITYLPVGRQTGLVSPRRASYRSHRRPRRSTSISLHPCARSIASVLFSRALFDRPTLRRGCLYLVGLNAHGNAHD